MLIHTYIHTYILTRRYGCNFPYGLLMAVLCKRTNSIIPTMLFHIMNNTLAFL
ncbi:MULTISPECIES: CPBP family glutamic-type intramembrane protease [Bacillus]|uniref:CPBP family glutamic-type intramembrane protease n=1 Tax=Bacillus TaxID=1386 RepID=UPI0034DCF14A